MLPLTHIYKFTGMPDDCCRRAMDEFAANGAKHLMFQSEWFRRTLGNMEYLRSLQRWMAEAGLSFMDAHAPFGLESDPNCPWEHLRPLVIERDKLVLRTAAEVGVHNITFHVGNASYADRFYTLDELQSYLLDTLEKLLPVAEECGIVIAIENIWTPTNTPERLLAAVRHFNSPYLGICYDAGHANLMHPRHSDTRELHSPNEAFEKYGPTQWDDKILEKVLPEVVCCHLHDNNGYRDEHKLPGYGDVDWEHIMGLLNKAPKLKFLTNESQNTPSIHAICERFDLLLRDPKLVKLSCKEK